jgi:hypothetical protein
MRLAFPEPLCIFLRNSRSTSVHDSAIEFEVQVKVVYSRECLLNIEAVGEGQTKGVGGNASSLGMVRVLDE